MRIAVLTIVEAVVLLLMGTAVGYAVNHVHGKRLDPTRNHFRRVELPPKPTSATNDEQASQTRSDVSPVMQTAAVSAPKHLEHGFQSISLDEVAEALREVQTEGDNPYPSIVFVDARSDRPFEEGRIPGAVQCDHYRLEKYIDAVLDRAQAAIKVIVYCNGGECEDSIFMCQDLMEAGISYDALYLFEGGWQEWSKAGLPIETGRP